MTVSLFHALVARAICVAVCAILLGALAVYAGGSRPGPHNPGSQSIGGAFSFVCVDEDRPGIPAQRCATFPGH